MNTNEEYLYSSQAYWRNGGYGAFMSALGGTLGLTKTGRVIFTLDGGKILFSAPAALIKRKNESMYGWMRFVIGPRLYTLQFYVNDRSAALIGASAAIATAAALTDAQKGREQFNAWVAQLDKAQSLAPDNEQLIAAVPTPGMLQARQFGMRAMRRAVYVILFTVLGMVLAGFVAGLLKAENFAAGVPLLLVAVAAAVLLYKKLRRMNKHRQQTEAELMRSSEDAMVQPADRFPAGTQPVGGFGMTTGKQILLGFAIVPAALIAVFIVVVIAMAIVIAIRG